MSQRDSFIHLVAGGVAGTVGAIVTCPLEVVKTRQQSSKSGFHNNHSLSSPPPPVLPPPPPPTQSLSTKLHQNNVQRRRLWTTRRHSRPPQVVALSGYDIPNRSTNKFGIIQCLKHIIKYEGPMALFKGLGPNLVGVAPSRAVYFATYSQAKTFWNNILPQDSPIVHVFSASCAGFMASTLTNPIWFVKTRLQLDINKNNQMTAIECVRRIYAQSGILGFYKGITASYMGISETIIHFVIYEAIKAELAAHHHAYSTTTNNNNHHNSDEKSSKDFLEFMLAGAISKTIASCLAYPHEVARTRLREEGNKYTGFWQTLSLVFKEEGIKGIYRGLKTQLVRQIPNTAIMMATYEAVVYLLTTRYNNNKSEFYDDEDD